jgi:hypothetical protein
MFPKASLTGRVVRTNNTMRMAKSWGAWRRPGAGATWAIILRIAPTTGYVALYRWGLFFQPPTIALAKGTAPFALLPAATGAFSARYFRSTPINGHRQTRPARPVRARFGRSLRPKTVSAGRSSDGAQPGNRMIFILEAVRRLG